MNFRSWQRWQLIEYALLQKISEEKAVENGKTLPQTKQEIRENMLFAFSLYSATIDLINNEFVAPSTIVIPSYLNTIIFGESSERL